MGAEPVWKLAAACGTLAFLLLVGIPVFDGLYNPPPPTGGDSGPAAPPPPPYAPPPYTNQTQLDALCAQACGVGGRCSQNAVTGITNCTACPAGFTRDPVMLSCIDTRSCAEWPWCDSQKAGVLFGLQAQVQALSPNHTDLPSDAVLPSQLTVPLSGHPDLPNTHAAFVALFNGFFAGRRALLDEGIQTLPNQFWDDQASAAGDSLVVYRALLPPPYAAYVTEMKQRVCLGSAWRPAEGACAPPV